MASPVWGACPMAVVSLPVPPLPHRTARATVQAENWTAVQSLYPAALQALKERIEASNDIGAIKIIMEASLPKGRLVAIGDDCSPSTVERALAQGTITPGEAAQIAAALKALREVETLERLTDRIAVIERVIGAV